MAPGARDRAPPRVERRVALHVYLIQHAVRPRGPALALARRREALRQREHLGGVVGAPNMSQALTRTSLRTRGRSHFSQPILQSSFLLVLPFIFAGLAIILSLGPHRRSPTSAVDPVGSRTRTVLLREEAVTIREADAANREAELRAIPHQDSWPTPPPL
ncbi:hypothetical protein B0H13DRAFT_2300444 [Mycena leptocephala]|nr:hypothetical protein B0H13DRAFT_2300444 [Mycena leptocephala]